MRKLLLDVPREMFAERFRSSVVPAPIALSASHGSPASRTLRSLLLSLAKGNGPDHADDLALELLGLLAAQRAGDRPASPTRLLHLLVAKDYIERHLHDPGLSARRIASALGISVRHLSRVFEPEGLTPSRYVMDRRLTRARNELADPASAHVTVAEIAHRLGFVSQPHFTRVFRERFDRTPAPRATAESYPQNLVLLLPGWTTAHAGHVPSGRSGPMATIAFSVPSTTTSRFAVAAEHPARPRRPAAPDRVRPLPRPHHRTARLAPAAGHPRRPHHPALGSGYVRAAARRPAGRTHLQ